jgi:single-strand DNA-binding protein
LQTRDWDGQDGVKRYRTEIVAENMIILDKRTGGGAPAGAPAAPAPFGNQGGGFVPPQPPMKDDPAVNVDDEIKVEDIPF